MSKTVNNRLSKIPSVNKIIESPTIERLIAEYSRELVVGMIQEAVTAYRKELGRTTSNIDDRQEDILHHLVVTVETRIRDFVKPSLRRVVNGTGIILHTGLGRAPLMKQARSRVTEMLEGYCSLELDLESGERGNRITHVEEMLCRLTGAEAACVVNNNAAAVLLVLNSLAFAREVIVSRGQLIEIGGSFRMPDVMAKSGVKMVEVGTTNRTHLNDYARAISTGTGLLCTVHTSNFRVKGFTKEVATPNLVALARKHSLPFFQDLGGGVLVDLRKLGLPHEPVVSDSIKQGVDVVSFSGDKVLGGPQSGIIVGKRKRLDEIKSNPLMRAVRCDKLTYAALEPTLSVYFQETDLLTSNQVLRMFLEPTELLNERADRIVQRINASASSRYDIHIEDSWIQAGSGALPLENLPSRAIVLRPKSVNTEQVARKFRMHDPPIVGYIRDDRLYLDLKTISPDQDNIVVDAINQVVLDQ
ncbi:L-seryl-tRNA(Sec) selenium transferase [bacterium]|nr:L-seryl-tRNA(Sec) selenium transferase [bacterium]